MRKGIRATVQSPRSQHLSGVLAGALGQGLEKREPVSGLPLPGGSGYPGDDAGEREYSDHGSREKQK